MLITPDSLFFLHLLDDIQNELLFCEREFLLFCRKSQKVELLVMPGLRPSLCSSVIQRWAKQIQFFSQGGVKPLKNSCYVTSVNGRARSLKNEKALGLLGEAAFILIFLKHVPFSYKVKTGFLYQYFSLSDYSSHQ